MFALIVLILIAWVAALANKVVILVVAVPILALTSPVSVMLNAVTVDVVLVQELYVLL